MYPMDQRSKPILSRSVKTLFALATLVPILAACSGEGQVGGLGSGSPTTNELSNSQQNVNGSLQGWVWATAHGSRLDVNTGELESLSGLGLSYPRADGREYVELIPEYESYFGHSCYGAASAETSAIHIRDSVTHESLSFMEKRLTLSGPALLSPDGQTIAVWAQPYDFCTEDDDRYIQLISRTGEYIRYSDTEVRSFDWMPDNRLVWMRYDLDDYAYILAVEDEPNTLYGKRLTTLPPMPGSPERFRISPDGKQVLFEVVSGYPVPLSGFSFREATVWVMDIDGSNLRQLADTSRPKETSLDRTLVNQPVWSPDSQHVLMTEHYTSGSHIYSGADSTSLTLESTSIATVNYDFLTYVVPTISELTLLPPESYSPTGVRPLLWSEGDGKTSPVQINPMPRQHWTPKVQ